MFNPEEAVSCCLSPTNLRARVFRYDEQQIARSRNVAACGMPCRERYLFGTCGEVRFLEEVDARAAYLRAHRLHPPDVGLPRRGENRATLTAHRQHLHARVEERAEIDDLAPERLKADPREGGTLDASERLRVLRVDLLLFFLCDLVSRQRQPNSGVGGEVEVRQASRVFREKEAQPARVAAYLVEDGLDEPGRHPASEEVSHRDDEDGAFAPCAFVIECRHVGETRVRESVQASGLERRQEALREESLRDARRVAERRAARVPAARERVDGATRPVDVLVRDVERRRLTGLAGGFADRL